MTSLPAAVVAQTEPVGSGRSVGNASDWRTPKPCAGPKCGVVFIPKRKKQRFAPDHRRCRRKHWELHHPRRGVKHPDRWNNRQAMWPTMRAVLALLKRGPTNIQELWTTAGPGCSTCLSKLRAKGHKIEYDRQAKMYRLETTR